MKFVSASAVSLEVYAAAFTSSFKGYLLPFTVDAAWLSRRVRHEQHDLLNSLIVFDGEKAVGMAALAVRGARGWCGGFGVVPRWRGRGLGQRLMAELVERARALELRSLSLEVLMGNTAAKRLYEQAGMRVTRDLLVLERPADWTPPARRRNVAPQEAPAVELLEHFKRLHRETPVWQRELPSQLSLEPQGFYLGPRAQPRAYALFRRATKGPTFLSDLAATDARQARAMCATLAHLGTPLRINNEPERSPFVTPLLEHGFREILRQQEMTMEL